jgi:hypothetical protein
MTTLTPRLDATRPTGSCRTAVVRVARQGAVVSDRRLGASLATAPEHGYVATYDARNDAERVAIAKHMFGGQWLRHRIGAEPAAVRGTP